MNRKNIEDDAGGAAMAEHFAYRPLTEGRAHGIFLYWSLHYD
jgi:hypothetical protein